jgi:uncharacterized membrane protein YvbJ
VEPPETCPNCGADVPRNARACSECGSDETTGWSEQAKYDALDLPDDSFDYDEFVKQEFGPKKSLATGRKFFWWIAAIIVLVMFIILLLK